VKLTAFAVPTMATMASGMNRYHGTNSFSRTVGRKMKSMPSRSGCQRTIDEIVAMMNSHPNLVFAERPLLPTP
jgi:hypothetical protein